MYAEIRFSGGASTEDVLTDIVAVLTGETNVNNLIADVYTETSYISVTSRPAGWAMYDDVSATEKVLAAPYSDMPGRLKYIKFEIFTKNNVRAIKLESYRDWDTSEHTGTMNRRISSSNQVQSTVENSNQYIYYRYDDNEPVSTVYISSSTRHLSCIVSTANSRLLNGMVLISERERFSPWDTVNNGHSPIAYTVYPMYLKTWYGTTTSDTQHRNQFNIETRPGKTGGVVDVNIDTGSIVVSSISTSIGSTWWALSTGSSNNILRIPSQIQDENLEFQKPIIGFGTQYSSLGDFGGSISSQSHIYIGPDTGETGELIISNDIRYKIWNLPNWLPTGVPNIANSTSYLYRFIVLEG